MFELALKDPEYEPDIVSVPVEVIVPPDNPLPVATDVTPLEVTYPAPFVRVTLLVGIVGVPVKSE